MKDKTKSLPIINWIFAVVFFVIGVLNAFLVHIIPGIFYILLASFYFPPAINHFKKRFSLSIYPFIRIIIGILILWSTLAVGDLMELFESWLLR